jgi:transcription initiation factor IIF auxiliary subunit
MLIQSFKEEINMEIETMLHKQLVDELNELKNSEAGSEQRRATVDEMTKLMDRAIKMEELGIEREAKENDRLLRIQQMDEDRKDRLVKNCMTAAGIILPVMLTVWGTLTSLKFEEESTVTTIVGRGFVNKLLPKK